MHPGATIYVGFGGFDSDVNLPEEFEKLFDDEGGGENVLTSDGEVVELPDEVVNHDPGMKEYFCRIQSDWPCYGFIIGEFDTAGTLDLAVLLERANERLPFACKIGKRYGITIEAKVHILSYLR